MIIDFHTHCFPDKLASTALETLASAADVQPFTDGTATGLMLAERAAGVDLSVVLPVATKPEQVRHINNGSIAMNAHTYVTGLLYLGAAHPDDALWAQELRRLHEAGVRGIKLHPVEQNVPIDDIRYLRILELAGELGMIAVLHAGYDLGHPGNDCCTPQRILRARRQLGPVTIVLAHMGGWRCWEDVQALLPDTDVYLDTAFSLGALTSRTDTAKDCSLLSDDAFCRIVRQFGARRIVFGTDCPWGSPRQDLQHIRALPLMAAEKAAILGGNAKRILNL